MSKLFAILFLLTTSSNLIYFTTHAVQMFYATAENVVVHMMTGMVAIRNLLNTH